MNNGWTPDRKTRQAKAIQRWKPWQRATGPKSPQGKAIVSRNAFKGARRPTFRSEMKILRASLAAYQEALEQLS